MGWNDHYTSASAQLLRAVTTKLEPSWTPEDGWIDVGDATEYTWLARAEGCMCDFEGHVRHGCTHEH